METNFHTVTVTSVGQFLDFIQHIDPPFILSYWISNMIMLSVLHGFPTVQPFLAMILLVPIDSLFRMTFPRS